MEDESPLVRFEAAACLGKISARVARPTPLPGSDPPGQVSELGNASRALLCRLLKDPSSDVRAEAARSLGMAGPAESSSKVLVAAAGDPDRDARLAIAEALLKLNGPDDRTVAKILCDLVADPGPVADRPQIVKILQRTSEATQDQARGARRLARPRRPGRPSGRDRLPGGSRPPGSWRLTRSRSCSTIGSPARAPGRHGDPRGGRGPVRDGGYGHGGHKPGPDDGRRHGGRRGLDRDESRRQAEPGSLGCCSR